ncbi:HAMP domain-containing sensor histidine kinase [Actinocorallia sp. A-T 12471]|uniref:sensor histidine kinase n=1 Tax=Actinocorallia sp. A-T 12471 TaxID=3089813 RepID=UPI0029CC5CBF|nr:HAMP domain-containing sensor histidine kinase [Actinocorallia sp. A-T 12471]MDX6739603.1 HAMP domain-containing sensor histidine kinase [Actinocorallia sp. A-T 12471]
MLGSVRARTTLAATAVVALALVAAAVPVVLALRAELVGGVSVAAEATAQRVADQWTAGTSSSSLRLPDDDPVRVVGADGRIVAQSPDLAVDGLPTVPPGPAEHDDDDEPETGFVTRTAVFEGDPAPYLFAAVSATSPDGIAVVVYGGADLSDTREAVSTTVRALLLGLPPVLLVTAAAAWLVTRRALRPVEAIRARLAGITAAGDLSARVPVPASSDEIARLAATTNGTLSALERSSERQRRFVADASHELRTPIASLRAQLEIAREHPELLDLDETVLDVYRLQNLASDLLLLAGLDADGAGPDPVRVPLAELVADVVAERAATDGVPVVYEESATPWVSVRPRRLGRALGNLLDNARRHAAGRVTVTVAEEGGLALVSVRDDGPGVPAEHRERIFERFVRLDDARASDEGGAGLGLALARELAEADGGSLVCADPGGPGALFELRLPRVADPDAAFGRS